MPTRAFVLEVHPDPQGRTSVTLTDPQNVRRAPVALGLQGERALYALMQYVRTADAVSNIDLLETWADAKPENTQIAPPLDEASIEEAIAKCGL
jgi:hypothetical protein